MYAVIPLLKRPHLGPEQLNNYQRFPVSRENPVSVRPAADTAAVVQSHISVCFLFNFTLGKVVNKLLKGNLGYYFYLSLISAWLSTL